MVKWWGFLFILLRFTSLFAEVSIESSINQSTGHVNFPIVGTITITHDKNAEIDANSFLMDGKRLETSLIKNVYLNGNTAIAIYSFSLPPKEAGLYFLPSISVKVDKRLYHSLQTSYSVVNSAPTAHSTSFKEASFLSLEAFVKGSSKLYPGERTTLVYRISFNRSIDLTKSELPFIHTNAFLKIGDAQIQEEQQGNLTIQEISQVVEATTIGSYLIGPSFVEGYAYQVNLLGKKEYDQQLLRAEAPPIEISVNLFSEKNQPTSFNGAIGKIRAEISLVTPVTTQPGQVVQLVLLVSGLSNLSDFRLPPLECQPGFSGIFYYDELSTYTEMEQDMKKVYFELRVLNSLAFEVPSIELSSFDLTSKSYQIIHTAAIPLKLKETPHSPLSMINLPLQIQPDENLLSQLFAQPVKALPLQNEPLTLEKVQLPIYQRNWIFSLIPLGLLFVGWQYWLKKKLTELQTRVLKSQYYLKQAKKSRDNSEILKFLEQALLWKLVELKTIEHPQLDLTSLPLSGEGENFRLLLQQLQALQYSPDKSFDKKILLQQVTLLFFE